MLATTELVRVFVVVALAEAGVAHGRELLQECFGFSRNQSTRK
jgi:hypothetical protein